MSAPVREAGFSACSQSDADRYTGGLIALPVGHLRLTILTSRGISSERTYIALLAGFTAAITIRFALTSSYSLHIRCIAAHVTWG